MDATPLAPQPAEAAPLRTAVIGVGALVVSMHLPALRLPAVQVVGVCDINPETGQPRADELGAPFYLDYRQMIAETRPDIAVITTPHYNHASIAIDCLRAGCHVLVEKPMALHVAEADAMVEAAQAAGRLLVVNFQQRHRPEIRAAYRLIRQGALGQIQRMKLITPWPRTARYYGMATWRATWPGEGGGVLMNQAPHDLDMICHLLGSPARVFAWTRTNVHRIEVEDTATALVEWPGGATGYIHVSTGESGPKDDIEIIGTGGILQIGPGKLIFNRYEVDARKFLLESDAVWHGPAACPAAIELEEGRGDHPAVYRALHAALGQGAPSTLIDDRAVAAGAEGRMSLELANAIIYSSYTRRTVELPLDREQYARLLTKLQAGRKFG